MLGCLPASTQRRKNNSSTIDDKKRKKICWGKINLCRFMSLLPPFASPRAPFIKNKLISKLNLIMMTTCGRKPAQKILQAGEMTRSSLLSINRSFFFVISFRVASRGFPDSDRRREREGKKLWEKNYFSPFIVSLIMLWLYTIMISGKALNNSLKTDC